MRRKKKHIMRKHIDESNARVVPDKWQFTPEELREIIKGFPPEWGVEYEDDGITQRKER